MCDAPQQKMLMILIPANQSMNGFCYSFSKLLFLKLLELRKQRRIFERQEHVEEFPDGVGGSRLLNFTNSILTFLVEQTKIKCEESINGINKFIVEVQEFLAIFEVEK